MNVLVYPFSDTVGIKKYMGIFTGWSDASKACIFLDPSDIEYEPLGCLPANQRNTICILGHCTEGGSVVRSQESFNRGDKDHRPGCTLNAAQLVDLLERLGLFNNALTRIKCMNCHSGMNFDGPDYNEAAFATLFKAELIHRGYRNMSVLAYMGALTFLPKPAPESKVPFRKFAILNTSHGKQAFNGKFLRFEVVGNVDTDTETANLKRKLVWEFEGDTGIALYV